MVLGMIHMRETRTRRGLSLTALEGLTGIDASTLSRYETGKQAPSVERGFLVARALGVSLESLVDSARGDSAPVDRDRGESTETHSAKINGGRTAAVMGSATPAHPGE